MIYKMNHNHPCNPCILRCIPMRNGSCIRRNFRCWRLLSRCHDTTGSTMSYMNHSLIHNWFHTTGGIRRYTTRSSVWKSLRTSPNRNPNKSWSMSCTRNWRMTNHSKCRNMSWSRGHHSLSCLRYSLLLWYMTAVAQGLSAHHPAEAEVCPPPVLKNIRRDINSLSLSFFSLILFYI